MRVGIYTRISVDRDGQSVAPERQEADAQAECASKGWTVADVYSDRNVSAFRRGVIRPEYNRMLSDVRSGLLDGIVVWKLDRLSRSVLDFMRTAELLKEHNCELVSLRDDVDTSTPLGVAMFQIMGVLAELEAATTADRVRSAHRYSAHQGKPHTGGHRPFGYSRQGAIIPGEAGELKAVRTKLLAGESLWTVASDLNGRGVQTTASNDWTTSSLSQTLRSPRLRGVRTYRGETFQGTWEPVFTEQEHLELLDLLSRGWSTKFLVNQEERWLT